MFLLHPYHRNWNSPNIRAALLNNPNNNNPKCILARKFIFCKNITNVFFFYFTTQRIHTRLFFFPLLCIYMLEPCILFQIIDFLLYLTRQALTILNLSYLFFFTHLNAIFLFSFLHYFSYSFYAFRYELTKNNIKLWENEFSLYSMSSWQWLFSYSGHNFFIFTFAIFYAYHF